MMPSATSTESQRENLLEGLSFSNEYTGAEKLIQNANQSIHSALGLRTAPLTMADRDQDKKTSTSPSFPARDQGEEGLSGILKFPSTPPQATAATLHASQEWQGYVVEIGTTSFVSRLVDVTAGSTYEQEEAIIPLAELSDEDSAKMQLGSVFRWVIGYERSVTGTKKRVSQIVFRDLPIITKTDLKNGEKWALETIQAFKL